jgi:hypothetical protein
MSETAANAAGGFGRVFDAQGLRPSELARRGLTGSVRSRDVSLLPDGEHEWEGQAFEVARGALGGQFLPRPLIASVHVPRAAGTTFRTWLFREWGARLVLDYGDQPLSSDYAARARAARGGPGVFLAAAARAVHGHFLASKYRAASPELAIWVRDPVERTASHFHFWRETAGDDDPNRTKRRFVERRLDLAGFAEMPELRDVHLRFMDGVALEAFAFVGVFEQLERSVRLFARMFGLAVPDPLPGPRDAGRPRAAGAPHGLSDRERTHIAALNRGDRDLYEAAVRRFEALCAQSGV